MGNKVKILYLIGSSEIGGTEKMLLLLSEKIKNNGFSPFIINLKGEGSFTEEVRKKGIKIYVFDIKKNPFLFFKFLKTVIEEKPKILHSFLFVSNIIGRIVGKLVGVPVIISSQRSTDEWRKWYHWILDYLTSIFSTGIISNCYSGKHVLIKKSKIPERKIFVIPNGIEIKEEVVSVLREEFGIRKDEYIVGNVGNLREAKGHKYLILASEYVLKEIPNTKFVIVGEGELKKNLIKLAKEKNIEQNFIFVGFYPYVERIVKIFDVFVLPSLWEGCPVSLLEAMAMGKPCISTNVGDVPFIIENGKNGIVVATKDIYGLADSIIMLLKNYDLRERIGKESLNTIKTKYLWNKMVNEYIFYYLKF